MSDGKVNLSQWALGYLASPPLVGWSWRVKLCIQDQLSVCIITIKNKLKNNNLKLDYHFLFPCWLIGRQLVQSVCLNFNCNRELHLTFYQMGVQTSMCQLLITFILGHLLAFFFFFFNAYIFVFQILIISVSSLTTIPDFFCPNSLLC